MSAFFLSLYSCILLKFYIKPQRNYFVNPQESVVSYWNSTSNHNTARRRSASVMVVSYWNSTSNHNLPCSCHSGVMVVSYWNSTSNHNSNRYSRFIVQLYLIEILHQTTTSLRTTFTEYRLYLIEILHQTTTAAVSLRTPSMLYLIEILHQTTTAAAAPSSWLSCILLKFYIKPQLYLGIFV